MNVETGEIKRFKTPDEFQEAMATGNWVPVGRMPKASCKKCFGRGHIGANDQGRYVACSCVRPNK
jgi:hypothetical protein